MISIVKLAWRNLWRNRRRTLITVASVVFGVLLSAYLTSMQEGSYDKMVDIVVKFYSGYLQVHEENYWENKSINHVFEVNDSLKEILKSYPEVSQSLPRFESFALASSENLTKGAMVMGIDPAEEDKWTGLSERVSRGSYLSAGDDGAIIGEGLAQYLHIGIHDTLVMISQGYHGASAAGKFPVKGIIRHISPELNKLIVYLDLKTCQDFFSAPGLVTSLVVNVADTRDMNGLLKKLKNNIKSPLKVMSWEEMQPEVVQQIESDRVGNLITKVILYIVIAFGILGTIIMMVTERKKELGVMISVGMQRNRLAAILFFETLFIGLLGVAAGLVVSLPVIFFQASHPIPLTGQMAQVMEDYGFEPFMFFATRLKVFTNQAITVFLLTLLISGYPMMTALRLNPIKSLKN